MYYYQMPNACGCNYMPYTTCNQKRGGYGYALIFSTIYSFSNNWRC
ncbi:MAG: hypothetical protein L6U99_02640 [Clostridium sp.]|nr:MAG: hypothetical protein L6U99_02640 [Clostridium sp.]